MIGFLIWNTGSAAYPVAFVYARDREEAKREVEKYFRENVLGFLKPWYNPDNWTVEPVTREQNYVENPHVIAPRVN